MLSLTKRRRIIAIKLNRQDSSGKTSSRGTPVRPEPRRSAQRRPSAITTGPDKT